MPRKKDPNKIPGKVGRPRKPVTEEVTKPKKEDTRHPNLKKGTKFSIEDKTRASEAGKKGGKRAQEVIRAKKSLKERMKLVMEMAAKASKLQRAIKKNLGMPIEQNADLLVGVVWMNALNGDLKAAEMVAKWSGEFTEEIKASIAVKESELSVAELKKMAEDFAND